MTCDFTSFSTIFQSYQDDERLMMKGCVQWNPVYNEEDLFLFGYERDIMLSLSEDNQSDGVEAFISTSWYLDDLLNIGNNFFDSMVSRIYPSELQLNKANVSDTEASFLDLHFSISDGFVKTTIYDKRDDYDFDMVNFSFLDGDVLRSTAFAV